MAPSEWHSNNISQLCGDLSAVDEERGRINKDRAIRSQALLESLLTNQVYEEPKDEEDNLHAEWHYKTSRAEMRDRDAGQGKWSGPTDRRGSSPSSPSPAHHSASNTCHASTAHKEAHRCREIPKDLLPLQRLHHLCHCHCPCHYRSSPGSTEFAKSVGSSMSLILSA
jgi:hypothetical protein